MVYEGDEEEYVTYCTPECRRAIDEYFAYRERHGEKVTPDSFVIRDEFNRQDHFSVAYPRQITANTISVVMTELMEKAGVRTRVRMSEGMVRSQVRHEIKAIHGLRKFWDTQMTLSGVSPLWIELLEGHKIKGMKHHYLRPTEDELLEGNDRVKGYVHAIDLLTLDPASRLQITVKQLRARNELIESRSQKKYRAIVRWLVLNSNAPEEQIDKLCLIDREETDDDTRQDRPSFNSDELLDALAERDVE